MAKGRPNLTIRLDAMVKRIIIEKGRAIGVELVANGITETIRAEREVLLSSGTIGSPKLLMHSGIAPADHLRSVGIATVFDQPNVGANLQDHLDIFVIAECTGDHTYDKICEPVLVCGRGPCSTSSRATGRVASSLFSQGGFWYADENARSPDIQFHFGLGSGIEAGVAKMKNAGATLNSALMRPRSRGTVRLASNKSGRASVDRSEITGPILMIARWRFAG